MGEQVLVDADGVRFYAQVASAGGAQPVGLNDVVSFEGVRETVTAIASQLSRAWEAVKPQEASVEFDLALTVKAGKLTGLLVDGSGSAALKVKLVWKDGED
jgi:hypothetical protein